MVRLARTARPTSPTPGGLASRRLAAGAVLVALSILPLTACGSDGGAKDSTLTPSTIVSTDPGGSDPGSDQRSDSESKSSAPVKSRSQADQVRTVSSTTGKAIGAEKAPAAAGFVTCSGVNTAITARPVSRPLNHLLLTVKNTGKQECALYYYPQVRFGTDAQSVPPAIEDSRPQAVVMLSPDESAYAGVLLSSADAQTKGYVEKSLEVGFMGRHQQPTGRIGRPSLPSKGVYIDESLRVTYWQTDLDDALSW